MKQSNQLRELAGEVLGLLPCEVPPQLICLSDDDDFARAITLRNAVHVLVQFMRGEQPRKADQPWSAQYHPDRVNLLAAELRRTGYLKAQVH